MLRKGAKGRTFLENRLAALAQCDDQGIGFYGIRYPVYIHVTAQLYHNAKRLPDFRTMVHWVYKLLDGRLWHKSPTCVGFNGRILRVVGQKQIGTEIVLERRDL